MQTFKTLKRWLAKRESKAKAVRGKDSDWSDSNLPPQSQVNMLCRVPSPVLSMVESYLGSKDKFNLRLTCKLMNTVLPQWELPLYRPHFIPTSRLHSSFISAVDENIHSPLFPHRFGSEQVIENGSVLRSSHALIRACMNCNHYLPQTAVTLPSLVCHDIDPPILNMGKDHHCFHDLPVTYSNTDTTSSSVTPYDTAIAVNLLNFNGPTFNGPTEYTSTVFLVCSGRCLRALASHLCASTRPVAVIGQEINYVKKLDDNRVGVELRYFTFFSRHLSLLVEYASTNMVIRRFKFRMENFHSRPVESPYLNLDFTTFAEISLDQAFAPSKTWMDVSMLATVSTRTSYEALLAGAHMGQNGGNLSWFPETEFSSEEFSLFLEHFPSIVVAHPHLYTEEENGEFLLMELTYSFSAIIFNIGTQWWMQAYVYDHGFGREQNIAILKNLRNNLQAQYEGSPMQKGFAAIQSPAQPFLTQRVLFEFNVLSCDESLDDSASVVSETSSAFSVDEMVTDDEEESENENFVGAVVHHDF